jgi:hypothetical protein
MGRDQGQESKGMSKKEREGGREGEREGGGGKQPLLQWVRSTWLLPGNCGVEL